MQAIPREILTNSEVTLVLFFAFFLLFLLKLYKPTRLYGYCLAFFTNGFIKNRANENPKIISRFHILLFIYSTTILALFLFLTTKHFKLSLNLPHFYFFFAVITYFIFRFFIDFCIGKILNIQENIRYFLFSRVGYFYTLSILLFPVLIIYQYTFKNGYFLVGGFTLLFTIRFALVFYNNKTLILSNLFYFILYLCALEITPLLITYKLLIE